MTFVYIFKKDKSLYWKETFENKDKADLWLEIEQTRPYWDKDYKVVIIDDETISESDIEIKNGNAKINEEKKQERIAQKQAQELQRQEKLAERAAVKALKEKETLSNQDVKRALKYILERLDNE